MSVRAVRAVLEGSRLKGAGRLVLVVLAEHADGAGVTWAGEELLAREANVDERTIRRVLPAAVAAGELEIRKARTGQSTRNVYRLIFAELDAPDLRRVPFKLDASFSAPGQVVPLKADTSTGHLRPKRVGKLSGPTRARQDRALTVRKQPSPSGGRAERAAGAQTVVAHFVDQSRERGASPPRRVVGQVASQVGALLAEGFSPESVRAGIDLMLRKGVAVPAALPSFVHEAELKTSRKERGSGAFAQYDT